MRNSRRSVNGSSEERIFTGRLKISRRRRDDPVLRGFKILLRGCNRGEMRERCSWSWVDFRGDGI